MRICFDQKIETWLRVHVDAFAELGGAPATIVPDNLKAAVVRAAFGVDGAVSLNRSRELRTSLREQARSAARRWSFALGVGDVMPVATREEVSARRWVDAIANTWRGHHATPTFFSPTR